VIAIGQLAFLLRQTAPFSNDGGAKCSIHRNGWSIGIGVDDARINQARERARLAGVGEQLQTRAGAKLRHFSSGIVAMVKDRYKRSDDRV